MVSWGYPTHADTYIIVTPEITDKIAIVREQTDFVVTIFALSVASALTLVKAVNTSFATST